MSEVRVTSELDEGILTLTLNRPDKRNAIDTLMVDALLEGLERADLDSDVKVVSVRGAGKDFCSGADLAELLASAEESPDENQKRAAHLGEVFIRMRRLPKPVVAAVHGRALAGGFGLATACDIVLAHAEAVFGYPEIERGFVPAMVMAMLRRSVSEKVAFDLLATGKRLSAQEACEIGLVSRVLPAESFEKDCKSISQRLASSSSTALALIKQELYNLEGRDFEAAIQLGAEVNAVARSTPEFKEAVTAFLEK